MEDRAMYAGLKETVWQQAERVAAEAHKERKAAASPGVTESFDPFDDLTPKESDPNGLAPHEPGAKLDAGKPLAGELILGFPRALAQLVDVVSYGANKYSRGGYLHVNNSNIRYLDAAMRHLLRYGVGEKDDPDSGLPHLAHCLWNIAAVIEIEARHEEDPGS